MFQFVFLKPGSHKRHNDVVMFVSLCCVVPTGDIKHRYKLCFAVA